MDKEKNIYWTLFWSMLQISTFTFGGGFVIIGMMRKKFCDELHYVTDDEVLDMTAIVQSSPEACVSALATVIPPIVIISVISFCYEVFSTNYYIQIALQVM